MPTEASVWGARVTAAGGHHMSEYGCKDCGVGWGLECTGALEAKKKKDKFRPFNSQLKSWFENHRASIKESLIHAAKELILMKIKHLLA